MKNKIQILLIVVFGVITACGAEPVREGPIYSSEFRQAEAAVKRLEIEVLKQYYGKVALAGWLKEQRDQGRGLR